VAKTGLVLGVSGVNAIGAELGSDVAPFLNEFLVGPNGMSTELPMNSFSFLQLCLVEISWHYSVSTSKRTFDTKCCKGFTSGLIRGLLFLVLQIVYSIISH
jgi:hypothetical protein